jgi:hypothetical protein
MGELNSYDFKVSQGLSDIIPSRKLRNHRTLIVFCIKAEMHAELIEQKYMCF